jgi:hypothetical protein
MSTRRPSRRRTSEQTAPAHKLRAWCGNCEKWGFFERDHAKDERKRLRSLDRSAGGDAPLSVYRCPTDSTRWHIGHDHQRASEAASYYTARGAS